MFALSMLLNIAVLVPVTLSILSDRPGAGLVWGPDTPGRRILLAIYIAILSASVVTLGLIAADRGDSATEIGRTLLSLQVVYKVLTWPLVGLANPVVRANLAIAGFHTATLYTLF